MSTSAKNTANRTLRAEASAWLAKLHGAERSPELEEDFRAWLAADAEHAQAFEQVTEVWDAVANVGIGGLPRIAAEEFPLDRMKGEGRRAAGRVKLVPKYAFAVAAMLALVGAWFYAQRTTYSTDIGEQRIVILDDRSRLYLNSNTTVRVEIGSGARSVELERGEAFFEVAKDPSRPFIVTAGGRAVTALGTSFVIRYEPDRTTVTLVEGSVSVAPAYPPPNSARSSLSSDVQRGSNAESSQRKLREMETEALILTPGQRVTFAQSRGATIDVPRPDTTASWRRGEVVLDETQLSAAIAEMNRYQKQQLVLEDAEIAALTISGIYRTGDSDDFARAIAAVYDLQVTTNDYEILLRKKRSD